MTEENKYLKAIQHPDELESLGAAAQYISEEAQREYEKLEEIAPSGEKIPNDEVGEWNYHKGQFDSLRMQGSLLWQMYFAEEARREQEEHDQ